MTIIKICALKYSENRKRVLTDKNKPFLIIQLKKITRNL